jgi:hypothetical protein
MVNDERQPAAFVLAAGLLLAGAGGAFAPWVWRAPVALQLTAPGLAEFIKFLPESRTLQVQVERLYFLLPLFVAMLALPLFAENRRLALPGWLSWLMRLAVFPLALAALSPVWTPTVLTAPEFRQQTLLALTAMGLAVIAPLLKGLPLKVMIGMLALAGLAAIALPLWQFGLVQPALSAVYYEPVSPGWGWWLTVLGLGLSLIGGVWAAFFIAPIPPPAE